MHPSLPDPKNSSQDAIDGTIFEELVQQYESLVTRTEDMIIQQVCTEVEAAWKIHFARCALTTSPRGVSVLLLAQSQQQQRTLLRYIYLAYPSSGTVCAVITPFSPASHSPTCTYQLDIPAYLFSSVYAHPSARDPLSPRTRNHQRRAQDPATRERAVG